GATHSSVHTTISVLEGLRHYELRGRVRGKEVRAAQMGRDPRAADAIALVETKRRADGRWSLENTHRGKSFFELERRGNPSRWNTTRALRVLNWWNRKAMSQ
ncbi:MAG TPA: hypothetical protein VFJ20_12510, partial [Gemmatimonadaceae bacterium]|nr:hypothetical protein [Gemmatimonadaceae bacterium]